jgi:hypothetical protein
MVTGRSLRGVCHEGSNHEKNPDRACARARLVSYSGIEGDIFGTTNYEGLSWRASFWRRQSATARFDEAEA